MAGFPDSWLDELFARSDIAQVVAGYVTLNSKGGKLWGHCPFHTDKTPSFCVTPEKGMYYCFSCHKGGNAINFIMEMERLSFYEAAQELAKSVGMEPPAVADNDKIKRERAQNDRLIALCRQAAVFFNQQLHSPVGKIALDYLKDRNLDYDTITRFGIGYAQDSWDALCKHLIAQGFTKEDIILANVANSKGEGSFYDTFRNRVMFPIINNYDKVIAFGARAMGEDKPKYLNTGETPIFNKRMNLYGLNYLKKQRNTDILIVEGYMDVVGLSRFNIKNAVASLGTALTQQQARLIKRYSTQVYLAYDGDSAGQKATLRGIDILQAEGINVKIITIPNNLDPDEYVSKYGFEGFESLKTQALATTAYKLNGIYKNFDDSPQGRQDCAKECCLLLSTLSPVEQEGYILNVAQNTSFPSDALRREIAQYSGNMPVLKNILPVYRNNTNKSLEIISPNRLVKEQIVVKSAFLDNSLLQFVDTSLLKSLAYIETIQALKDNPNCNESIVFAKLDQEHVDKVASALSTPDLIDVNYSFNEAILALQILGLQEEKVLLQLELEQEQTIQSRKFELLLMIKELNSKIIALELTERG